MVEGWISCDNCGKRFGTFLSKCPQCGAKSSASKKRMGKGKKIAIGAGIMVGAFFVIMIGIGMAATMSSKAVESQSASKPQASNGIQQQTLITASLTDFLPTRDDVGTELGINKAESTNIDFESHYNLAWHGMGNLSSYSGFEEGLRQTYGSRGSYFVFIGRFDSATDALAAYTGFMEKMYNKGGYTEYHPSGINADKCYGRSEDIGFYTAVNIYCVKNNIYFHTYADEVYAPKLQKILADQILAAESESQQQSKVYTGSLSDLLPVREDIGTQYEIGKIHEDITTDYGGLTTMLDDINMKHDSKLQDLLGFQDTILQQFSGYDVMLIRFDTPQHAADAYDKLITYNYEKGGYTEVDFSDIGNGANCYGKGTGLLRLEVFCVKENIYIHTTESDFAKIVVDKIN